MRAFNIIVAFILLVVTLPVSLLITVLIAITSGFPIIYKQSRIGFREKEFIMYKFRTMRVGCSNHHWTLENDPRVTFVGKWLRKFRLDEIPQLINVIKGDMDMVGPRPEQADLYDYICRQLVRYPFRKIVRPGITGLAQITLPYDRSLDDVKKKLEVDLTYIRKKSILLDIKIMTRTPAVMLGVKNKNSAL